MKGDEEGALMEKIITYETLRNFTYSNDKLCAKPVKGIVLNFKGLNFREMISEDDELSLRLAGQGIIYLTPYYNPWCWMNAQAVAYADEIIDVLIDKYQLPEDIPVISSGNSMGGLSSLVYTAKAKRTPAACVSNCPVCDLPFHLTERPDLPRTLYSAFWGYEGTMEEALRSNSPLHLAEEMPDIPYHIFHCEEDKSVNKQIHSDRFVEAMRKSHRVEYYEIPGRGHCDLSPEMRERYNRLLEEMI